MDVARRVAALAVVTLLGAVPAAQAPAPPAPPQLAPDEMAAFLAKGRILERRDAGIGVTASLRATISDGRITHDAHIQTVDVTQPVFQTAKGTELNFRDSYLFNIAGYRLAVLLGLDNVPMSVERTIDGRKAAVTWWVDDVVMDEKGRMEKKTAGPNPARTVDQIQLMRIWDELIQNKDRNQGNILWTIDWKMWLIDHTRAFRLGDELLKPEQLVRAPRAFLERLRALTIEELTAATKGVLTRVEVAALMTRRDRIVKLYDDRIAKLGEAQVLY
jgi:hypothetical protein